MRRARRGCLSSLGILLIAGVVAAVWPVGPLTPQVAAAARPAPGLLPWLATRDRRVVDPTGRTVLLRGFNSEALIEYPDHASAPLDDTDARLIEATGATVVRLGITWSSIEPRRGAFSQAYLERVAASVALLARHRLYTVLDMHFQPNWGPSFGGAGAPSWANIPGIPDIAWGNDLARKNLSPGANAATTYFWLSGDWQADFMAAWRFIAARFTGESAVAGYDIYNEPRPAPIPPALFEKYAMWPLVARAIEAISSVDPNHLYIAEGTLWLDQSTLVVPVRAPDLVYAPHVYTGSLVPPAFNGDPSQLAVVFGRRRDEAAALGAPLWLGEIGIDHKSAHATAWADAVLDLADDAGAGWAWWQWRQSDTPWAIRDIGGDRIDTAFLRHVARPFLAAAPVGVTGGRGDGVRGRLDVRVAAGHAAGAVDVAWPTLTLGTPIAAGACLTGQAWDMAASRLVVELAPGASCDIQVRVG